MTNLRNSTSLPGNSQNTKFFNLPNVTYKANEITVALFNTCRPIENDENGKFIWVAYDFEGTGVWAKKERR